ncbi:hypothetical protein ALC62_13658 [Cyphomyrmex costatus]|uniref:Uncharacterized protein n=1 Tax=Cyphomyrmex costatus TaxID=456900 RepID=A0A151I9E0_9HYME|nr:hypothetical protein ALC62_13658 [Cyphomyrmex costatus]
MIVIFPNDFPSHNSSSLSTVRDKWFINLSSVDIPHNIQCFLQLGENFALPFNKKSRIIFDCIKNIESSILKMPINKKMTVTNHSIPILKNIITSSCFTSLTDKTILKLESDTVEFLSSHDNIIFTYADKGNITVAMDREDYTYEHRLKYGHDFQWDNIKILDEEPCYRKRLISEMLHIKRQKNSLNLQTDTEGLHDAYVPIINKV